MQLNLSHEEVLKAVIAEYGDLLSDMGILNPEMTYGTAGFFIKEKEKPEDKT